VSKSVRQIPGVLAADVNFASGVLVLEYDADADPRSRVLAVVSGAGHTAESLEPGIPPAPRSWWARNRAEVIVAASGALIALGWLLGTVGGDQVAAYAYAAAIIVGGTITWRRAAVSLAAKSLDMNVLMTIAVLGAAAIGEWGEGATVIFLFALGGALESRSLARTRRSIRDLMGLAPQQARVRRGTAEVMLPLADVRVGEVVVVRPGERVPLDGVLVRGVSAFDESAITGESVPADKSEGEAVYAGTLNTTGLVEVRTSALASDGTLRRIVQLVETAQASRAPVQRLVDRFSRYYTPAVIALAVAIAVGVPLLGSLGAPWGGFGEWREWAYRALVLLVVSCPCALVISTPVAIVSAITRATRDGVLVKGGAFLELAGTARAVAFDKTGTLTHGRPRLVRTLTFGGSEHDALRDAAALEAHSNHPLARAIVEAADPAGPVPVEDLVETAGLGVSGTVEGRSLAIGSLRRAMESGGIGQGARDAADALESDGLTVLVLSEGDAESGRTVALFGLADEVRAEAPGVMAALRDAGIEHVVMLTGDNERVAARIAATAGIPEYRAALLPADKTDAVRDIRERFGGVVMVGDGINDAPALATADVGIAMAAMGSDTAIETADVALMRDDLAAVPRFLALGRRTMAIIRQNVALSIGVKVLVLGLALAGKATLWMAVFADTGMALIVIANGLRLLRAR
jgi:Cd2+/Zn2+-exporting ATPase